APISVSTPSRSRSSDCRWWRCRSRCRRCRSECRSSPHPGAGTWHCASPTRPRRRASRPPRGRRERIASSEMRLGERQTVPNVLLAVRHSLLEEDPMQIDLPEVVAEVRAAFDRYEQALVSNDVTTLDAIFRDDPRTIRYGGAEILYGHD